PAFSHVARDRAALRRRVVAEIERHLVDVAPPPALGRIVALDDRVMRLAIVRRGVTMRRVVAAADVAAAPAEPQMHPGRAPSEALLAAERARLDLANARHVIASFAHRLLPA